MYTEEDEDVIDDARAVLRDRIVRLRRKNARVARSRADLHLQLEKWQSVMPLVNQVTSRVSSAIDVEDTENNGASSAGSGPTLSEAVTQVLRDTAQLSAASEQVQGAYGSFVGTPLLLCLLLLTPDFVNPPNVFKSSFQRPCQN